MAGKYRFPTNQKDIVTFLITTVGSFIQDQLINKERRAQHKEQCAERLAAEDGSCEKNSEVRYSDQAVLANLDWGIDALEEAINTSNMEAKLARLDHAEKMLQVCAMLSSEQRTAGVPNFYLSAWAHLNLSYLCKLQGNIHNSVLHILEMFIVDPFFSRIDFAPELWKALFLPHMSSIVGWYSEARHKIVMEVIPDSNDLSFTADFDQFFNESLIISMRPDQAEKMQQLEQLYGELLDENTRLYAKYFMDCLNFDPKTSKRAIPMLPIAEPPMTPMQELSRSIPDFVKFGPILPRSAGFSPILKAKDNAREASRLNVTSLSSQNLEESVTWDLQDEMMEENEYNSEFEPDGAYLDSEDKTHQAVCQSSMKMNIHKEMGPRVQPSKIMSQMPSSRSLSSMDSPETSKISSPDLDLEYRNGLKPILRLLSSHVMDSTVSNSLHGSPPLCNDSSISSADSDGEVIELPRSCRKNYEHNQSSNQNLNRQVSANSSLNESYEGSQSCISLPLFDKLTPRSRPPKDFVCPITGQIFSNPVTLETGQTFEQKAIEEWLKRGNTTCPITRQPLTASTLPKTNYVLKRLITTWKEQHPDIAQEFSNPETPRNSFIPPSVKEIVSVSSPSCTLADHVKSDYYTNQKCKRFMQMVVSTSPTSVISQAATDAVIDGLKPYVSCLCDSNDLQECEAAVLAIAKIWEDSKANTGIHSYLSEPTIVNGLLEILSASLNREVLRISIHILSVLMFAHKSVGETLINVGSAFDCLAALLEKGLAEAAVLINQLRPTFTQLSACNFITSLVQIIQNKNDDSDNLLLVMEPKDAAIALLEQILMGGDGNTRSRNAMRVISANGVTALIKCLDKVEGRQAIVSILLCCIHADKSCRNLIANKIDLSSVLELFHTGDDCVRDLCTKLLSELVQLNRRTFCNQILKIIKDEGAFSTMHTFLVYLQMAPMEQQPAIASLLLQLDLLVEPRKMSIYREEAIEALVEALHRKDFPHSQITALDALLSLCGHLTTSGKSYTEAWLLKMGGYDQAYHALMKSEKLKIYENEMTETMEEEAEAETSWRKRVVFVLCNHEKGSIFKALEECFRSNSLEIAKSSLVIATWLTYMLYNLPDTGVRDVVHKSFLEPFINVLQSSKNLEEKILATLALNCFLNDPSASSELGVYAKCMYRALRKLKRNSVVVSDMLKALIRLPSIDPTELWCCDEVFELDSCSNGGILCLLPLRSWVLSGHSDGTIKVWDASGKRELKLIQEVREHTKAVTCLYTSSSSDNHLYSGSLDKTIRVWGLKAEKIDCGEVHDVKEAVYQLTANPKYACFSSQGTGVNVYSWSGVPRHINFNKSVKCLDMAGDKLYCGCTGYNIQEVDLCDSTSSTFYSGTRKLLGKQTIYALRIHDGFLYAGGSSVDGTAGKVFCLSKNSSKALITGSFSTGLDIKHLAVNGDFVFTGGSKSGIIEVWLKETVTKVASIKVPGHSKLASLASSHTNREMLLAGTIDGNIQVWALE